MDLKRSGMLIAQRRKELGMTQKELADRLEVTDKAVSRWETGKGFPDSALLQPLAKALDVSIVEIFNGERTQPLIAGQQADEALLAAMNYTKRMTNPVLGVMLLVLGTMFAVAPMYVVGSPTVLLWGISAVCYGWGVLQYWGNWPNEKWAQRIATALLVLALILQTVKGSTVMHFAMGPDQSKAVYYSCFDMGMLMGYAMFPPVISALMNVVNVIMALMVLRGKKESVRNKLFIGTIVSGGFMVMPLVLFAPKYLTLLGFYIVLLLFCSAMFQSRANGNK